ncbi:Transposon Ty3-I Gag-Pol polyprotein [Araneus ventricosus]|uniref:Transposon Ty3-I Gag-Pol polyprotein n=1 Tax=Araneus ventricosus TaxID=182803 RepID=A0A4Y2AK25_ARAVE|nr:Transposon Ty3-I Gag-Pol polyprotein [Araneus ventricosus]
MERKKRSDEGSVESLQRLSDDDYWGSASKGFDFSEEWSSSAQNSKLSSLSLTMRKNDDLNQFDLLRCDGLNEVAENKSSSEELWASHILSVEEEIQAQKLAKSFNPLEFHLKQLRRSWDLHQKKCAIPVYIPHHQGIPKHFSELTVLIVVEVQHTTATTVFVYQQLCVVSPVDKPADWVNSLVIVEKPNGKLRICLDPRNLNKAIKREQYVIPSVDEIIRRLEGKQCFSVLDLKEGFWQIPLDKDSAELCTFNLPFGCYKFNRLPFGICSAPEVFQKKNQKLFGDIKGFEIYFDDLIIVGKNKEEHDKISLEVLERAKENIIKINPNKFQFRIEEVKYMGLLVSKDKIKAYPSHVRGINGLEKPTSKNDIKRLLVMVNFLSKFIPNVSAVTSPLRVLLKKVLEFQWNHEQETSFEEIKRLISSTPVLKVQPPIDFSDTGVRNGIWIFMLMPLTRAMDQKFEKLFAVMTKMESGQERMEKEQNETKRIEERQEEMKNQIQAHMESQIEGITEHINGCI